MKSLERVCCPLDINACCPSTLPASALGLTPFIAPPPVVSTVTIVATSTVIPVTMATVITTVTATIVPAAAIAATAVPAVASAAAGVALTTSWVRGAASLSCVTTTTGAPATSTWCAAFTTARANQKVVLPCSGELAFMRLRRSRREETNRCGRLSDMTRHVTQYLQFQTGCLAMDAAFCHCRPACTSAGPALAALVTALLHPLVPLPGHGLREVDLDAPHVDQDVVHLEICLLTILLLRELDEGVVEGVARLVIADDFTTANEHQVTGCTAVPPQAPQP